jgi:hypothetical protein
MKLNSCIFGFGEIGLGGAAPAALSVGLPICSKWERREDTGF